MGSKLKITFKTLKVPKEFVYIDGNEFSLSYMYKILDGIEGGEGCFTDKKEIELLKKIGLIKDEGNSRWCIAASKGRNFKAIYDKVMNHG